MRYFLSIVKRSLFKYENKHIYHYWFSTQIVIEGSIVKDTKIWQWSLFSYLFNIECLDIYVTHLRYLPLNIISLQTDCTKWQPYDFLKILDIFYIRYFLDIFLSFRYFMKIIRRNQFVLHLWIYDIPSILYCWLNKTLVNKRRAMIILGTCPLCHLFVTPILWKRIIQEYGEND